MAHIIRGRSQKSGNYSIVLLNPAEKGRKYAKELSQGVKRTNSGSFKLDENKKAIRLGLSERAYRAGYLDARKDGAKAFNAKQGKKLRKK